MRLSMIHAVVMQVALATVAWGQLPPGHPPLPETKPASTAPATAPAPNAKSDSPRDGEKLSTTEHTLALGTQTLRYRATAGLMPLKAEDGKLRANMFFVAYTADAGDQKTGSPRPITFVFNGGPGAAAVWLHLGTAGPKRIDLLPDGRVPKPPYRLVDNEQTWLTATDLVFIDPVGTGFSRPASKEEGKEFYGVQEDISSVGEFIRLYLTRFDRWDAPKFLAGESYGTTRAAGLSEHLHERLGIDLNGIMLISTVLHFQTIQFAEGNDLPYALYLPSFTATAHFHQKLPAELQRGDRGKLLGEVERWATEVYLPALTKGSALGAEERAAVVKQLSRYTGLPEEYIERSGLRVRPERFEQRLLNAQHQLVGRMDARLTGPQADPANDAQEYDPSLSGYVGVYSQTFNAYVRRELKFESDLSYEILSGRVHPWNFGPAGSGYLNVGDNLRNAMFRVPTMRVMVAAGYFDLATPFSAANFTVRHLGLPPDLQKNVVQTYYDGGHMMYHPKAGLEKLHADVERFIGESQR